MGESTENVIGKMIEILEEAIQDAIKFDAGNKAAGTRVRKSLNDIKTMAHSERKSISARKNA